MGKFSPEQRRKLCNVGAELDSIVFVMELFGLIRNILYYKIVFTPVYSLYGQSDKRC